MDIGHVDNNFACHVPKLVSGHGAARSFFDAPVSHHCASLLSQTLRPSVIFVFYLVYDTKKMSWSARLDHGQVFRVKFIVYRFCRILKNTSLEEIGTLPMHNVDPTSPRMFVEFFALVVRSARVYFRRNLSFVDRLD